MTMRGKPKSEEVKQKLSKSVKAFWDSHEHHKHSPETRAKISIGLKGKRWTEERKEHYKSVMKLRHYQGAEHPRWLPEGTKRIHLNGYVLVKVLLPKKKIGSHSRYWIREHILVWEQTHNMQLPKGYVVHHLNGIKDDNRPQNLLAVPIKGHSPTLTVKEVQARLREVEAELTQKRLSDIMGINRQEMPK